MRPLATKERVMQFLSRLARGTRVPVRVYLTGGATAILFGWRESTVDVDIRFEPEVDEIFRAIPKLKEELNLNVELASPPDFIPELPGWRERSVFIDSFGSVSLFHFDLYSQAMSKIERGHAKDRTDVEAMLSRGLIEQDKMLQLFELIRPNLYKYPAINETAFASAVYAIFEEDEE